MIFHCMGVVFLLENNPGSKSESLWLWGEKVLNFVIKQFSCAFLLVIVIWLFLYLFIFLLKT